MNPPDPRRVACPICRKQVEWTTDSPWRPFCSERCRLVDLAAWASGSYRIPAVERDDQDPDPPGETKA